jgi:hypothetical protein
MEILDAFKIKLEKWLCGINIKDQITEYRTLKERIFKNSKVIESLSKFAEPQKCGICRDKSISVAANPCGHTFCKDCSDKNLQQMNGPVPTRIREQQKCPYCSTNVLNYIKIYFS